MRYLERQVYGKSIEVLLRRHVNISLIKERRPDAVVIATGSIPKIPEIPGMETVDHSFVDQVLNDEVELGKQIAIIGGGWAACDTALYLAAKGRSVVVLRRGKRFGIEFGGSIRKLILNDIRKAGITMISEVVYKSISKDGLIFNKNGEEHLINAENFIVAIGYEPYTDLYNEVKNGIPETYIIGDAKEPRSIFESVHEGFEISLTV